MGICVSHEATETAQQIEIAEKFKNFAKTEERPPMTVEHQTYDYKQAEEEQDDERLAILSCPHSIGFKSDKIVLVDLDSSSPTFCQIVSEINLTSNGDEPGRINWTKSAEFFSDMQKVVRSHLVIPCMNTNKIYVVAFENNKFRIEKEIKNDDLIRKDVSTPYAVNSLPIAGAPIHISIMGDKNGHGKGDFVLLERKTWEIRKKSTSTFSNFGGHFSLQPRHNIMISCEWGQPRLFRNGLTADDLENVSGTFGSNLHVWQISPPKLLQTIELNPNDGCLVSIVRFLHNSDCNHAFACSAIGGSIFHIHMNTLTKTWKADRVVKIPSVKVDNWQSDEMPPMLTDMLISMDDRFLFVCGYLHGFVWKYDIQDPFRVSLNSRINLGGILASSPEVRIRPSNIMEDRWWLPPEDSNQPKGVRFRGGPALMQLSKDGCRLYVSNSFYKAWDAQFYPELLSSGGQMVRIDVSEKYMRLNENFLVDMDDGKNNHYVIRDIRFVDGDCTSDSFL